MGAEEDRLQYELDRNASYDRILAVVKTHIDALTPPFTADISVLSPSDAKDAAERSVWLLFQRGIAHLKNGGQMDQPGLFSEAVSRASLRSAPISATLGIAPPKFQDNYLNLEFDGGAAEAVFRCQRMLEAVAADAPKSQQLIRQKLGFTAPLTVPEKAPDIADPELKGVFDAALKSRTSRREEDALLVSIRRQSVLSFNLLCDLYAPMTEVLKQEISDLFRQPPTRPTLKNQSFDF
jgi:hypothetical protein